MRPNSIFLKSNVSDAEKALVFKNVGLWGRFWGVLDVKMRYFSKKPVPMTAIGPKKAGKRNFHKNSVQNSESTQKIR